MSRSIFACAGRSSMVCPSLVEVPRVRGGADARVADGTVHAHTASIGTTPYCVGGSTNEGCARVASISRLVGMIRPDPTGSGAMFAALSGPGTVVLERTPVDPHEPESVADGPLIGFDAFTLDYRVFGWVRLTADRLTDLLNAHDAVELVNAQVRDLVYGATETIDGLVVPRGDLVAVRAGEPRGDPTRRERTRLHALSVRCGPYRIGGFFHARPGADPLHELAGRPPIVPLSLAWIEHWRDGRRDGDWSGTILFNRLIADAIEVVRDEDIALDP